MTLVKFPHHKTRPAAFRPKLTGRDDLEEIGSAELIRSLSVDVLGVSMDGVMATHGCVEEVIGIITEMAAEKAAIWRKARDD